MDGEVIDVALSAMQAVQLSLCGQAGARPVLLSQQCSTLLQSTTALSSLLASTLAIDSPAACLCSLRYALRASTAAKSWRRQGDGQGEELTLARRRLEMVGFIVLKALGESPKVSNFDWWG